jgi:hypothetical protein
MNYQIQGLFIHAEVHGTASRLSDFSITGVEHRGESTSTKPVVRLLVGKNEGSSERKAGLR